MASKNRLQPPCKVLHFYNTPPGLTEEDLRKVFEENGTAFPADIRLLQNKSTIINLFVACSFLLIFIQFFGQVKKVRPAIWSLARSRRPSKPSSSATTFPFPAPVRSILLN
jgi:hypothetical protein